MRVYRAIGEAERQDLLANSLLRPGPNSCEGKHFAVTEADAIEWGSRYYLADFWVICVEIDEATLRDWMRFDYNLDGIGNAYFAEAEQLSGCKLVDMILIEHPRI